MMRAALTAVLFGVLPSLACAQANEAPQPEPAPAAEAPEPTLAPEEVTFPSSDGVTIHADVYLPTRGTEPVADNPLAPAENAAPRALILAFHMAGADARGEYGPYTAPRLVENGYAVLTPDLRLGGDRLGSENRTVAALTEAGVPELDSYCDTYPDVLATLDFAEAWLAEHYPEATGEQAIPIVAIGSSYSATLVLRLAAEEGDRLAGVISCSPAAGDPMAGCQPEDFYEHIDLPRMILIPERETSSQTKRHFLTNARVLGFIVHVEPGGVHGSLTLDPERNKDHDAETAWDKMLGFLSRATE